MMSKKLELPKTTFVRWNTDGDEPWLEIVQDIKSFRLENETCEIGIYKLEQKTKIVNRTMLEQ